MKKQDLVDILMANDTIADKHTAEELLKEKKVVLEAMVDEHTGDELDPVAGSRVRQTYRDKYAKNATEHGRKAHTFEGRATLNNGDQLALLLESLSPQETCNLCDAVQELKTGETQAKYAHLNQGMQRMNAGNRIRAVIKREDNEVSIDTVSKQAKAIVAIRPADKAA